MKQSNNLLPQVEQREPLHISAISSTNAFSNQQKGNPPSLTSSGVDGESTFKSVRQPEISTQLATPNDDEWNDEKKCTSKVTIQAKAVFSRTSAPETSSLEQSSFETYLKKKKKKFSTTMGYWEDKWALEIFCCIFALLNLVAIIIVLVAQQNKPIPQWPGLISINSLISVFTALMKAAMMVPVAEGMKHTLS